MTSSPAVKRVFLVRNAKQLRVLNAAERRGVVEAMASLGRATAAELGARIGLRPEAAHYHLRRLESIGLAREACRRPTGRRPEVIWELTAGDVRLAPSRATAAFREEKIRGSRLFLRRAERDLSVAIEKGRDSEDSQRVRITRDTARLNDREVRRVESLMEEIADVMRSAGGRTEGELLSVTMVVAPVADASRSG